MSNTTHAMTANGLPHASPHYHILQKL